MYVYVIKIHYKNLICNMYKNILLRVKMNSTPP